MERIGLELGVDRTALYRWQKRFGWKRPAPPDKGGPGFFRSRRFSRPYGGDAIGLARDLVTGSRLPIGRIAAQAGISRSTLYRWIERGGWVRQPAVAARLGGYRPPYGPAIVAAARELYCTTELSVAFIAARVKTTPARIGHWARKGGWMRPRDLPDPHGRVRLKRIRRPRGNAAAG